VIIAHRSSKTDTSTVKLLIMSKTCLIFLHVKGWWGEDIANGLTASVATKYKMTTMRLPVPIAQNQDKDEFILFPPVPGVYCEEFAAITSQEQGRLL
jgi:hypothetical protein